ncbi:flavin reductase (DIM6/NTAB) family NADH-FMN oxidoreductase RutF [Aliiruegeria haliotis]|uniref:Flavin reductase (DIM6/NTAB) family NADH-FMN oxidoreductase RutF n=1 Tax=Aliiruegeria haliotis TaxID=1280846 RepID=A0A2T0RY07_9RHOB|nr:flavin reductase family protein [Aliiruegeria haliotis]PRY26065.1 flavin reductase (DIM6/NTAB) family NADH-FMN oxidoreductase RutF [Aliiruegeria haliotis]
MNTETFTPGPGRERALRTALGAFATGVTVVTCRTPDGPLGFTANSFSSVSIDPPLVLWCPAVASPRHDAFVAAHDFSIHVLEAHQLAISEQFAAEAANFDGIDWTDGEKGVPWIDGCLTRLDCRHFAAHGAGDHTIVIGQVDRVTHVPGAPLLFALGAYGRMASGPF